MNKVQNESYAILIEIDRICKKNKIDYFLSSGTLIGAIRHKGFIPWDDDLDIGMTRENFQKFESIVCSELDDKYFYQADKTEKYYFNSFSKIRSNHLKVVERPTKFAPIHQGAWVDIFPYDLVPDDHQKRNRQYKKIQNIDKTIRWFCYIYPSDNDKGMKRFLKSTIQVINSKIIRFNILLPILFNKREKLLKKYNADNCNYYNMLSYPLSVEEYSRNLVKKEHIEELINKEFEGKLYPVPKNYDIILKNKYGDYLTLPPIQERIPSHFIKVEKFD